VLALAAIALLKATTPLGEPSTLEELAWPREAARGRWFLVVALLTSGALGALTISVRWATWWLDFMPNASEGIDESLLYGSTFTAALSFAEGVICAPVAEELLFRGALFGGLAKHVSIHTAAWLSAVVFSVIHGYGLVSSLVVFVVGYVLARAYARTGSLLPGILAHAMSNVIPLLAVLAMRATSG
jgi:uncharacterized protein